MNKTDWLVLLLLVIGAILSVSLQKLTRAAAISGLGIGWLLFKGAGLPALYSMTAFFVMAVMATHTGHAAKTRLGVAQNKKERRDWDQVLANAGVPALIAIGINIFPPFQAPGTLAIFAAFASAAADTVSSEMGVVWGKNCYNILTLKPAGRGENGAISLQGTLAGIMASMIIACLYAFSFANWPGCWWILLAGTLGNLSDSVAGATLENRGFIGNNTVNVINTLVATFVALLLHFLA